ncbi:MAG: HAMP domain-containing sensor histidine kinase [Bifidobacteriaceae bacterium]|nr:HAMP domain-containing sensor histidine kinase [Bifidobacteriaceae bacterium]
MSEPARPSQAAQSSQSAQPAQSAQSSDHSSGFTEPAQPQAEVSERRAGRATREGAKRHSALIGSLSSIKVELSVLIVIDTIIVFILSWVMLKWGLSEWIAFPVTMLVALGITYVFSRGLTAQLREIRDAAEAVSDGDYQVRVYGATSSKDEIGQLARSFNIMAEELEHSDAMRRDLIANVSHELRTPVAALQAQVENMADGITEPSPANLEGILTQTHRLSDLIAFLLDLSRMEAGAASLEISEFDLRDFLDETIEPLEIADGGHNHTIEVSMKQDITMEGDPDRLRQLFTNIISNALKHSADGTKVLITAREYRPHDTVIVNVINFGSQIPKSARNDIFRRYVKDKDGRPGTESGGTGLGLPIARWAAQLHGGNVKVVDDPRGADFEITLPKHHRESDAGTSALS